MNSEIVRVVDYYNLLPSFNIKDKFHIVCPFHSDTDASCFVYVANNTFHCFSCGATGDSLQFVKRMENSNSMQAIIKLSEIIGSSENSDINIKYSKKINYLQALEDARIYFDSLSKPSWKFINNNYMNIRGFNAKTLITNDIKINVNSKYQIICPIYDLKRFKGYIKRRTDGNDSECKYLYNLGFRRKFVVMGDYNLGKWVPITEGYFDWLKFKQFGVENASAIFGWEITDRQIEKIKEHTNYVISALDNTPTGEDGTKKLQKYFNVVRFQFPYGIKDIGDLTQIQFNKAWLDTLQEISKFEKRKRKENE